MLTFDEKLLSRAYDSEKEISLGSDDEFIIVDCRFGCLFSNSFESRCEYLRS